MAFDYDRETKSHYQDNDVVASYDQAFTAALSWRTARFRFVANRERATVQRLLHGLPVNRILDIPCGSGKLAPVLVASARNIIASDISNEMLALARERYAAAGGHDITLVRGDAERLSTEFGQAGIDVTVCLRLLHRVPDATRERMLGEIAQVSRYAIVSFGVSSSFHRCRRSFRNILFARGGRGTAPVDALCQQPLSVIEAQLLKHFRIIRRQWIAPFLSEEILFLVERSN